MGSCIKDVQLTIINQRSNKYSTWIASGRFLLSLHEQRSFREPEPPCGILTVLCCAVSSNMNRVVAQIDHVRLKAF